MPIEVRPLDTSRARAFELWMDAPNPMVTLIKTLDITNLVRLRKRKGYKVNMLLEYCIGKAAVNIKEFYILPVEKKLVKYDRIAISTIVMNRNNDINSCDVQYVPDLESFSSEYIKYTSYTYNTCNDRDLSENCMVIGTSAVTETEIDGAVGMYSGVFNNPFLIWGRYRRKLLRYWLPVSFQFHHTQMDGSHAARFFENLQKEINRMK